MIKVAFIFPGQGAQTVGMGREFYETVPDAKQLFDEADSVIPGLKEVIFNGPPEKLTSTAYCQPAILTMSMAALKALHLSPAANKLSPQFVCGLSLGELSALCASGALSFPETLKLVERRSFFMEEATRLQKGTMAAVIGLDKDTIVSVCRETKAEVANFNSLDQIVITGREEAVLKASEVLKEKGAKRVIPLSVSGAFHSSLMQPAVAPFQKELEKFTFHPAQIALISNVDAVPTKDPQTIRKNLTEQITSSVQWVATIQYLAQQSVNQLIEIGPGSVLKGLVRKIDRTLNVQNIQTPQDIEKLSFN